MGRGGPDSRPEPYPAARRRMAHWGPGTHNGADARRRALVRVRLVSLPRSQEPRPKAVERPAADRPGDPRRSRGGTAEGDRLGRRRVEPRVVDPRGLGHPFAGTRRADRTPARSDEPPPLPGDVFRVGPRRSPLTDDVEP